MYTTSRLIFPSRKSSLRLSGQLKFHSPKITAVFKHFSLSFHLVVSCSFLKKYFSSIPWAEKLKQLRKIQSMLIQRNVLEFRQSFSMFSSQQEVCFMFHDSILGMSMFWLFHLETIRKKNSIWYVKGIFSLFINIYGFLEIFHF